MFTSLIRIETRTGQPIRVKSTQVRLRSQVIHFRAPIANGGLLWNRPVEVIVHTSDGEEQILAIPDLTRIAVLALVGICFVGMFMLMLFRRRKIDS